ncbi:MAG: Cell division coordinator CpoB [Chlamydiia bacterium]|nr:Cell division coordinator CpoB [Chlamydiia bacterium]
MNRYHISLLSLFILTSTNVTVDAARRHTTQVDQSISSEVQDKEEAFLVRRIAEFWKDQDYKLVKSQITEFLKKYPNSRMNDNLRGILADLHLQEDQYREALNIYRKIKDRDIQEKILINKLQCYYELSEFDSIIAEGEDYLTSTSPEIMNRRSEFHFLMAEAYFRTASDIPDQKQELYGKARPLYEELMASPFSDPAMFALAEIYRHDGENQSAARLYSQLAEAHGDKREDLLFHAGLSQAAFDKDAALDTFAQIVEMNGAKSNDAGLNRLILLFQLERYDEVVEQHDRFVVSMSDGNKTSFDYIIGRSYYALGKHKQASEYLSQYLNFEMENSAEYRNTLLMQMSCAQAEMDENLYLSTMQKFNERYPNDPELPQALFIHALMLKDSGDFAGAENQLATLINDFPSFEDNESLYLEYSITAHTNQHWDKAHSILKSYLAQYSDSQHAKVAWKYFLSSSLNLLKASETDLDSPYTKRDFAEDLSQVLSVENVLEEDEYRECKFLQGKIAYELNKYEEALSYFEQYLEVFPGDEKSAELHLFIALCHHELGGDLAQFCAHGEQAISSNPDIKNRASLHIELFNVYISRIEKEHDAELKEEFYDKAAENLYQAYLLSEQPIKRENQLWLANHYFNRLKEPASLYEVEYFTHEVDDATSFERSYEIFASVLLSNETQRLDRIDYQQTYYEWEVLKLAHLMGRKSNLNQKIVLLRDLIEQQNKHSSWDWKLRKEALLELAKAYESARDVENAYETFHFVASQFRDQSSFASEYATLHSGRLRFDLMRTEEKVESNQEVVGILNDLKELQIKKNVVSEPIHLEASLEYAWIRTHLTGIQDQPARYIFFLERIKEDYNNSDDPIVQNYISSMADDQDKQLLFDTYMRFLDAEMLRAKAKIEMNNDHIALSEEYNSKALDVLADFKDKEYVTHYLHNRIAGSIDAINRQNLY